MHIGLSLTLAAIVAIIQPALAQDYPSRNVTMVVPFPPCGGTDTGARIIAQSLSERWKKPVIVENKPGAAGNIGLDFVDACVWPDGRTARDAVKPMIAGFLMASYPDRGFVQQMGLTVPDELEAVVSQKHEARSYDAWRLVPDDFVEAFTWAGTPDEVARQVAEIVKLGISQITYLPQPPPGQRVEPLLQSDRSR